MGQRSGWLPPSAPGTVALVTGASSGIGADLARGLARRGHGIALVARRADRLDAVAGEISRAGGTAWPFACDLTDAAAREDLEAELTRRGLSVSVLCNNAGAGAPGHFHRVPVAGQLDQVRLHVEALVDLCGRFVPAMVAGRQGAVLNVCSLSSLIPWPAMATYAATKAAALRFSEALHTELRPHGVAVTAVCPGFVRTEYIAVAGLAQAAAQAPAWIFEEPRDVAEHALHALDRNRRVAVHSLLYRTSAAAVRALPNAVVLAALDRWSPFRRDGPVAGGTTAPHRPGTEG
jgi:short-subunit dehydrogenase